MSGLNKFDAGESDGSNKTPSTEGDDTMIGGWWVNPTYWVGVLE